MSRAVSGTRVTRVYIPVRCPAQVHEKRNSGEVSIFHVNWDFAVTIGSLPFPQGLSSVAARVPERGRWCGNQIGRGSPLPPVYSNCSDCSRGWREKVACLPQRKKFPKEMPKSHKADIPQVACWLTGRSPNFARWTSIFRPNRCLRSRKLLEQGGSDRSRRVLAQRRCFLAQRADLSCRFRSFWGWIAVTRAPVALAIGGSWRGWRVPSGR